MPTFTDRPAGWSQTLFATLLGGVLGTALQLQQAALWDWKIYMAFVLAGLVGCARPAIKNIAIWSRRVIALGAMAALAFGLTGLRAGAYLADSLNSALEGRDLWVTGVVVNLPQRNEAALRFRLRVESALLDDKPIPVPALMDIGWYSGAYPAGPGAALGTEGDGTAATTAAAPSTVLALNRVPASVQAGERWQMQLRFKAPHGARNPFGFDYELWLWEQGVQATGYVRAGAKDRAPVRLSQTWQAPVALARQTVRDAIYARVERRQLAGMIAALVVGDQTAIDRSDWDVFRATGVAHLVSISGLHITMFAWGAALVVGWLWRRSGRLCRAMPAPTAALLGGVLLATAYSAFAGWGIPAQRTCWMLATVALLRLSGARWPWPLVWMLACAVVVACDPWALLQAGFWLSFVAVGILFATDSGAARARSMRLGGQNDNSNDAGPPQGVRAPLGGSAARVAASVGALSNDAGPPQGVRAPLGGSAARVAASVGALSNDAGPPQGVRAPLGGSAARVAASVGAMFREQWVITVALTPLTLLLFGQVSVVGLVANAVAIPWVTLVVTPLAMLGAVVSPAWDGAALALQGLLVVLQWLARWPGATVTFAMPPLWVGAGGVLGGALLVAPLPWTLRTLGLPLLVPVLLWQAPRPPEGQFELLAADIGQGNAVLVRTHQHALLFDAGPRFSLESDAGHRVLVPLLQALDAKLDMVVLSHRDMDHVGGATAVLTMQPQAELLSSIEAGNSLQALRPAKRCKAGQAWDWDGVHFAVIHPQAADYDPAEKPQKPNAMSCVLRIGNGQQTALLTGDIEQPQEARLVAGNADQPIRADILLTPHHGSNTSSSAEFLDAVAPRLAIVQSGYRNRFGHPTPRVVDRYADRHIVVVDSPHCGAFTWQSGSDADARFGACTRLERRRYWHHSVP